MAKLNDENYLDYKKRVIDPISPTFCAAKWLNATIWLNRGWTTSCHLPAHHQASRWSILWNPSALHNTAHKKKMRKMMLSGQRPAECEYCWKVEDIKRNAVSDRVFKTVIYDDHDIQSIASASPNENVALKTLEISFDRTCNFACSYCNAGFSTTWAQDIKKNGPYQLQSKGGDTFKMDGSREEYKGENNPYIKAFWRWWPSLTHSLRELRITGGEPLMSRETWKVLDDFREQKLDHIQLAVNSNLGARDELIDQLIEKSHGIKNLEIYTSNEAVGAQAEYIRDGLNYERWVKNIKKMQQQGNFKRIHIMMTINALCLFSITDLFDEVLSWRTSADPYIGYWSINFLRYPSFMSSLVLPDHIKTERHKHLVKWFEKNQHHPFIHEMEREGVYRLVKYLEHVESPHENTSPLQLQQQDFVAFYKQYDQRRGKDFQKVFPKELNEWMASL